MYKELK